MKTLAVLEKLLKGKRIKEGTRRHYVKALTSLANYSEEFPVSGVVIDEWTATLTQCADITAAMLYDCVRAAGNYVKKISGRNQYGYPNVPNPCDDATRPKVLKKQRRYFSPEELMAIVGACRFGYERELVLTLMDSGCRISDLAGLKGGDVGEDMFNVLDGKTGQRKYRLDGRICQALRQLAVNEDSYVFTTGRSRWSPVGEPIKPNALGMRVRCIIKRAGIRGKKLGPHSIRHSVGSLVAAKTLSPLAVKAILQQDKVDTAMIYVHDVEDQVQQRLSPLELIRERAYNGDRQNGHNGIQPEQLEMGEGELPGESELPGTSLAVMGEPEIVDKEPDYLEDMFPEVLDDIQIRPLLKTDDLRLMRKAFVLFTRDENYHLEMLKARGLMRRILRKTK